MCASAKIRKFQIKSMDFRKIFESVQDGDIVYCDPPYLPKSETASFSDYTMTGFVLQDYIDLAQCAFDAANRGATVIICNHWNKEAKKIYKDMFHCKTKLLNVSRTISCKAKSRKPIKEVIVVFDSIK